MSKAYARYGILVNAVSPVFIDTSTTDAMAEKCAKRKESSFKDAVASFLKEECSTLELQRRGEAKEVAAALLLLCSRQASFINGTNPKTDGGSVATMSVACRRCR